MTITIEHLAGHNELFSDTIRHLLAREWELDHTPKIMSALGEGDSVNKMEMTENDFLSARKGEDQDFIRVYDGDTTILEATNQFVELESSVYIDVFGEKQMLLSYVNEIDRILFENQANGSARINTSAGTASAIWTMSYVPNWRRLAETREEGLPEQYAGEIKIQWQKTKSS